MVNQVKEIQRQAAVIASMAENVGSEIQRAHEIPNKEMRARGETFIPEVIAEARVQIAAIRKKTDQLEAHIDSVWGERIGSKG